MRAPNRQAPMSANACIMRTAVAERQRGVALAIVVWFLAAMSLVVVGIVFQAKVDNQMAQLHLSKARVTAVGDGAMQLMLADVVAGDAESTRSGGPLQGIYQLGEERVTVNLVPVSGLIDLRLAPQKTLSQLFMVVGEMEQDVANQLAASVLKWRTDARSGERTGALNAARFSALEDLLRVEGVTRTHLDKLADVVYVGKGGASETDWSSAPDALLEMVAPTNPKAASALAGRSEAVEEQTARRGQRNKSSGKSRAGGGGSYRVDAIVFLGGQQWLRRRFVSMRSGKSGELPWSYFRSEPARVLAGK